MPRISTPKEERRILEPIDVELMIDRAPRLMDKAIIATYYIFGIRRNEAFSMRKENVWMDSDWLYLKVKREKVPKNRVLPRVDTLKVSKGTRFLQYLVAHWDSLNEGDMLFPYHPNPKTCAVYVWKMIKKCDPNVWPHLFRHTRAERFREAGYSDMDLMAWFGWVDPKTAARYTHPSTKTIEDMGSDIR